MSPGSIARSSIGGCRPPDPGSNPGQGAKNFEIFINALKFKINLGPAVAQPGRASELALKANGEAVGLRFKRKLISLPG